MNRIQITRHQLANNQRKQLEFHPLEQKSESTIVLRSCHRNDAEACLSLVLILHSDT